MKTIFKTAMFAVAVMAAGYGGVKAYKAYNISQSEIGLENIEAFTYELSEVTITCGRYEGRCWTRNHWLSCEEGIWGYHCHRTGYQQDSCYGVTDSYCWWC